jgi:hypothetical protein
MAACKEHIWFKSWITGEWMCSECETRYEDDLRESIFETQEAIAKVAGIDLHPPPPPQALGKRQRLVLNVLWDGHWHDGPELTHPEVGGSEGLRRLRELREKGYDIEMRKKAKGRTTRQYRLSRVRTEY